MLTIPGMRNTGCFGLIFVCNFSFRPGVSVCANCAARYSASCGGIDCFDGRKSTDSPFYYVHVSLLYLS